MDAKQLLDLATQSARDQLELNKQMLANQLEASDQIYLRRNAEAVSAAAMQILAADPTR